MVFCLKGVHIQVWKSRIDHFFNLYTSLWCFGRNFLRKIYI